MPAQQYKPVLRGEFAYLALRQRFALRRHIDYPRRRFVLCFYRLNTVVNRLCLHYKSRSAAVRLVVNVSVAVFGVQPYIVSVNLDKSVFYSPTHNACVKYTVAHIGKQRRNINPHLNYSTSKSPSSGFIRITPFSTSIFLTTSSMQGNISSVPSARFIE